jgi:hypothetical protein
MMPSPTAPTERSLSFSAYGESESGAVEGGGGGAK